MAEDSFHPIWTPSTAKLEELIKKLRRRDNLEDFVDGLIETEIYPYPSGQKTIVPATYIPVQDVCIKTGAAAILTTIEIRGIPPPIGSDTKFVYSDVTMTLTPQDGVGTYEMEYQWPSKLREDAPTPPTRQDFERIRMAMWARYEWVLERIDWINRLRNEAHVIVDEGQFKLADHINADLDSNCSEASDWDQVDGESICSHDSVSPRCFRHSVGGLLTSTPRTILLMTAPTQTIQLSFLMLMLWEHLISSFYRICSNRRNSRASTVP